MPQVTLFPSAWNQFMDDVRCFMWSLSSCSVWWEAAMPLLPPRGGWRGTCPLTSARRVHPNCPVREKWRRSLHPRLASTRGGNSRTNTGALSVCTTHTPLPVLIRQTHFYLMTVTVSFCSPTPWLLWCPDNGCHPPSSHLPQPGNTHREPGEWT